MVLKWILGVFLNSEKLPSIVSLWPRSLWLWRRIVQDPEGFNSQVWGKGFAFHLFLLKVCKFFFPSSKRVKTLGLQFSYLLTAKVYQYCYIVELEAKPSSFFHTSFFSIASHFWSFLSRIYLYIDYIFFFFFLLSFCNISSLCEC
jgi:hypothetical protein